MFSEFESTNDRKEGRPWTSSHPACDGHGTFSRHPFIVTVFATANQPSECILRQISILDLSNKQGTVSRHSLRYPLYLTKSFHSSNLMIRVGGFDMIIVFHHDYYRMYQQNWSDVVSRLEHVNEWRRKYVLTSFEGLQINQLQGHNIDPDISASDGTAHININGSNCSRYSARA